MRGVGMLALPLLLAIAPTVSAQPVEGDGIAASLTGRPGDPARGADLIADRQRSLCVLCHGGPFPNPHMHGTLAPDLTGVGGRLSEGQIRLRIVDMKRLNPATIMPSYFRVEEGQEADRRRIADAWRGRPVLSAEEIEDLIAYLVTLKD